MNVVFVEPFFPNNQREFVRALAAVGATVIGLGETPADNLDDELKSWLHHYQQVSSVTDVEAMSCRPPGVGCWDLHTAGNDFDFYPQWAMAIVHGRTDAAPSRRLSCGIVALRPDRDGHITHYDDPDFDTLHGMLAAVGSALRVHAA